MLLGYCAGVTDERELCRSCLSWFEGKIENLKLGGLSSFGRITSSISYFIEASIETARIRTSVNQTFSVDTY